MRSNYTNGSNGDSRKNGRKYKPVLDSTTKIIVAVISGSATVAATALGAFLANNSPQNPGPPTASPPSPSPVPSPSPAATASTPAVTSSQGSTAIWTGYEYPDYKGRSWTFYADARCDANGFAFDTSRIGWGIRSWKAHAGCWRTTVYYDSRPSGNLSYAYSQGWYEASQIGSGLDDHVWSVWTRY